MAFSVQNIAFTTDTGYFYDSDDLEFTGGVCAAKSGFTGTSIVVTPTLDVSSWHSIAYLVMTAHENANSPTARYFHDVLISFDAGASTDPTAVVWKRFYKGGWLPVVWTTIATYGMSLDELENVREWPVPSNLTLAFNVHRESGADLGNLDNIAISYSPTAAHEDQTADFPGEPASDADLATSPALYPNFPLDYSYVTHETLMATPGGYHIAWRRATRMRRTIESPKWVVRNSTDRDSVLAFLLAHIGHASFTWDPPGCVSGCKWVALEPITHVQRHGGAWEIGCASLVEVMP